MNNGRNNQKTVGILGSTGSIGTQALDVCRNLGYTVGCLAAGSDVETLALQVNEFHPAAVALADEKGYEKLKELLRGYPGEILCGRESLCQAAAWEGNDIVLNAVVGIVGLRPTLAAIGAGKDVALANKETLVAGGGLVMAKAREKGIRILPVDSEHSAIFQCLESGSRQDLAGVVLTASGGPFFGQGRKALEAVSVEDALRHPNWSMGPKITVDSATMVNKGLEFIEAMWLFGLAPEQIEVVVHRQSILHSAVVFSDHSVIGQMGVPDMRVAIQYALTWPRHLPSPAAKLSLTEIGAMSFEKPDLEAFNALSACIRAAELGGLYPAAVNGANEELVSLFLEGRISFTQIGDTLTKLLGKEIDGASDSLEAIEAADSAARQWVREFL